MCGPPSLGSRSIAELAVDLLKNIGTTASFSAVNSTQLWWIAGGDERRLSADTSNMTVVVNTPAAGLKFWLCFQLGFACPGAALPSTLSVLKIQTWSKSNSKRIKGKIVRRLKGDALRPRWTEEANPPGVRLSHLRVGKSLRKVTVEVDGRREI